MVRLRICLITDGFCLTLSWSVDSQVFFGECWQLCFEGFVLLDPARRQLWVAGGLPVFMVATVVEVVWGVGN